jgi:hypothetical protein
MPPCHSLLEPNYSLKTVTAVTGAGAGYLDLWLDRPAGGTKGDKQNGTAWARSLRSVGPTSETVGVAATRRHPPSPRFLRTLPRGSSRRVAPLTVSCSTTSTPTGTAARSSMTSKTRRDGLLERRNEITNASIPCCSPNEPCPQRPQRRHLCPPMLSVRIPLRSKTTHIC